MLRAKYTLVSSLTSNHGVSLGNLHTGELVKMYFKMHIFTTSKYVFIVLAKNILESSLIIAHDGHMGKRDVVANVTEFHVTNTHT